ARRIERRLHALVGATEPDLAHQDADLGLARRVRDAAGGPHRRRQQQKRAHQRTSNFRKSDGTSSGLKPSLPSEESTTTRSPRTSTASTWMPNGLSSSCSARCAALAFSMRLGPW